MNKEERIEGGWRGEKKSRQDERSKGKTGGGKEGEERRGDERRFEERIKEHSKGVKIQRD